MNRSVGVRPSFREYISAHTVEPETPKISAHAPKTTGLAGHVSSWTWATTLPKR